jgi:hypothetical protein
MTFTPAERRGSAAFDYPSPTSYGVVGVIPDALLRRSSDTPRTSRLEPAPLRSGYEPASGVVPMRWHNRYDRHSLSFSSFQPFDYREPEDPVSSAKTSRRVQVERRSPSRSDMPYISFSRYDRSTDIFSRSPF